MEEVLDSNAGAITPDIAWQALQAASQEPNPKDVTSNTQWSILYDNTRITHKTKNILYVDANYKR